MKCRLLYLSSLFVVLAFWGCKAGPADDGVIGELVGRTATTSGDTPKCGSNMVPVCLLPLGTDLDSLIVKRSVVCMLRDEIFGRPMLAVTHKSKVYFGCCKDSLNAITAKPGKYRFANDPITGERVDKADAIIINFKGRAVYLANRENARAFAKKHGLAQ